MGRGRSSCTASTGPSMLYGLSTSVLWRTVRADVVGHAFVTEQDEFATGEVCTVVELAGRFATTFAHADHLGVGAELVVHTRVEQVQGSLPETVVTELLTVTNDASFDLIDLLEAAAPHHRRQHLATNSPGAIRDDRSILQVVVPTAVELGDEVTRRRHVGNDRALEPPDAGFEGISSVEEHHVVAA